MRGQGGGRKLQFVRLQLCSCYQIERVILIFQLNVIIFQFKIIKKWKKSDFIHYLLLGGLTAYLVNYMVGVTVANFDAEPVHFSDRF